MGELTATGGFKVVTSGFIAYGEVGCSEDAGAGVRSVGSPTSTKPSRLPEGAASKATQGTCPCLRLVCLTADWCRITHVLCG